MTSYVDPDGYDWEVAEDYIQGHVLGFCLCGKPEDSLSLVRDVLRHISNLKEFVWSKQQTFEEWAAAGEKICDKRAMYFIYYFLDSKGLTEHGGAVPGWLTTDGEILLKELEGLNLNDS